MQLIPILYWVKLLCGRLMMANDDSSELNPEDLRKSRVASNQALLSETEIIEC